MHKIVSRASINLFKVPFHGTDIYRTGFLTRIFPKLSTVEGINSILNYVPFRNKTAQHLNNTYRIMASYLTGVLLHSPGTTLQNWTDHFRNMMQFGIKNTNEANKILKDSATRKKVEAIIAKSGITEFSDFFSKSMINNILDQQIEVGISDEILVSMMNYHNNNFKYNKISNIKLRNKMREENKVKFIETVDSLLKKSNSIMSSNDYFQAMLSKEDIKTRRKRIKQDKRLYMTNKLVQFAIEKEYEFMHAIKETPWDNFVDKTAGAAIRGYISAYKYVSSLGGRYTMSSTEKYIRSLSFVIGSQRVWKAGLVNQDTEWYNYTDEKDINQIITAGRIYSEKMNFGLSTQAVGEYNYNSLGNLMGKFKYWSQQKFGSDIRLFKDAYISMKSMEKIESDAFDFKAVAKTISRMFRGNKMLRITNPEVVALKNFLLTQGLLTALVDIATLGVFPIFNSALGLKKILYWGSGGKALRGFTSDLVSLSMMPFWIAIKALSGGFDEDEEERAIRYYLRKTFFGFVPMWSFEFAIEFIGKMHEGVEEVMQSVWNATSVWGGGTLPHMEYVIDPTMKSVIKGEPPPLIDVLLPD